MVLVQIGLCQGIFHDMLSYPWPWVWIMIGLGLLPESVGQTFFWFHRYLRTPKPGNGWSHLTCAYFWDGWNHQLDSITFLRTNMVLENWSPWKKRIPLPIPSMGRTVYLYTYMKTIQINQMKVDIPWMDPVVFTYMKKNIKNQPSMGIRKYTNYSSQWDLLCMGEDRQKLPGPPGGFLLVWRKHGGLVPHQDLGQVSPPTVTSSGVESPKRSTSTAVPFAPPPGLEGWRDGDEWTIGARQYFHGSYWYGWSPEILNNHRARVE